MNSPSTAPAPSSTRENSSAGRGRPRLLTPEVAAKIVKMVRIYGLSDSHAALLAGVSTSSVSRWKQESEDFSDYLEGARAEFERDRILALLDATKADGTPDWRAQAWLLRNSSAEGGWGRAAKPLHQTTSQKPEILPKNSESASTPELRRPADSPAPLAGTANLRPAAEHRRQEPENPEILPKNAELPVNGPEQPASVRREAAVTHVGAASPSPASSVSAETPLPSVGGDSNTLPKTVPLPCDSNLSRSARLAPEPGPALSQAA